ncbi:MAG: hypothetical protein K5774_07495 [Clostridia bacterium]|nr:hypothetical protein [Clostridia bacterium]
MEKERAIINKAVRKLPRGELRVWKNGSGRISQFRQYQYEGETHLKGIGRDLEQVYALAHKAYLIAKLRRLEENMRILKAGSRKLLSLDPEDILRDLPKNYGVLDLLRVIEPATAAAADRPNPVFDRSVRPVPAALDLGSSDVREWASRPYCANTKNLHLKVHTTSKGVACRSKNEVLMLEKYDSLSVPYHYDEVVFLKDRYASPDVIFPDPDGRLIYHEHAGLRSDGYLRDLADKVRSYASCGILPGDNLIVTFDHEDGGINMDLIESLIRDRLRR